MISLVPHPSFEPSDIQVSFDLSGALTGKFIIQGDTGNYEIPPIEKKKRRVDGLWNETCFELFTGAIAQENYWEMNLSAGGHWNLYAFDSYRKGMREESRIQAISHDQRKTATGVEIHFELPLAGLFLGQSALNLGAAVVLKAKNGVKSYWAVKHCSETPDFHRRETFIITFPKKL